jgi:hypothetical protein
MLAIGAALMANYAWWRVSQTLPPAAFTGEYAIALIFLFTESSGGGRAVELFSRPDPQPVGQRRRQRGMARRGSALSFGRRADLLL